ncbi:MAG: ankyrin repeat domain-containing protein [Pseudorhodoplanes sp.]|jgi:ankyrin repeat protein|nr:ankyrin repeat domain-containing protein [Pseudorhodoplanes sp.]
MTTAHSGPAEDQALLAAAARGDTASVKGLLDGGASVQARDGSGRTALLLATHGNHVEAARVLIAAGADVNAKDNKMTLEAGADLKSTNRYGGTALIPAAHHGHAETVKILLATAIDKDHVNALGWTALLEAVILGDGGRTYTEIVRLLVEAGANVNIADRDGVTSLTHAKRHGYSQIARILESRAGVSAASFPARRRRRRDRPVRNRR